MLSNFFNFYNGKEYIQYTFEPGDTLYNLHYNGNRRNVSLLLFANDEEHVINIFKEAVELMAQCAEEYYCICPKHLEPWVYSSYVEKSINILEDIKENKNFIISLANRNQVYKSEWAYNETL